MSGSVAAIDHGILANLDQDHHTQYVLLLGRAGGQTIIGGIDDGDTLTLRSCTGEACGVRIYPGDWLQLPEFTGAPSDAPLAGWGRFVPMPDGHVYWQNSDGDLLDLTSETEDHGGLTGLLDDDHLQYFKLLGRTSGQVAIGGTVSGGYLKLRSTSHADKGGVQIMPDDWLVLPYITAPNEALFPASSGGLYAKADGRIYWKNKLGEEFDLASSDDTSTPNGGLTYTGVKSDDYSASAGEFVRCSTVLRSFTVQLPSTPATDDSIGIIITAAPAAGTSHIITIDGNGHSVIGRRYDGKLYLLDDMVTLKYDGAAWRTIGVSLTPHSARMHRGVAQSIPDTTLTKINLDTADYDFGELTNTVTHKIVIRRPNVYVVTCSLAFLFSVADFVTIKLYLNGVEIRDFPKEIPGVLNFMALTHGSHQAVLAAGDQLEIYVVQGNNVQTTRTDIQYTPLLEVAEII